MFAWLVCLSIHVSMVGVEGYEKGYVGGVWWSMLVVCICSCEFIVYLSYEGDYW